MEDIRRDKFVVDFQVEDGLDNVRVPHFLFIPFVENVVKHGAHQAMKNGLHVQISFTCIAKHSDFRYLIRSCAAIKMKTPLE